MAYASALRQAAETIGGETQLARRLGVDASDVRAWISGRAEAPLSAFLHALDVIADGPYRRAMASRRDPLIDSVGRG